MQLTSPFGAVFDLTEIDRHRWRARVDDTWRGWTGPHGGVIAGLAVAAAESAVGDEVAVRALDLRFLGRPRDGELTLRAERHPVGRTTHVVDIAVLQDEDTVAAASVTLGRTRAGTIDDRFDRTAPQVPAPDACALFRLPTDIVPAAAHFEIRPAAGPLPLTGSDETCMTVWTALIPELPLDAPSLAVLADALPPAIFPALTAPVAVPTVTMSLHVHTDDFDPLARRALVRAANVSTGGGWSVDDIDIWDERGRLLATARQSRRVLG
ncbi:thioesterase family protein [Nocardia sp. NEAU-351]|uniref:Thioesterase family protein n=2 Tax=Nocardia bovistercoris TaxID=2785916 RepID=A0A931IB17_9NOCA|nr:thioesterase family protein [Nocardia bovistercoris]